MNIDSNKNSAKNTPACNPIQVSANINNNGIGCSLKNFPSKTRHDPPM